MTEWNVLVEARRPEGEELLGAHDPAIGEFFELLADYGGAVSSSDIYWAARVSIDADEILDVYPVAIDVVLKAAEKAGLPMWPVVRAELTDALEFKMDLERPVFPFVMGGAEVCELLGITKQRLHQMRGAGRFPEPTAQLASGPIWLRTTIESFAQTWDRRPGRRRPTSCPWCDHPRSEVRQVVPNGVRVDQRCTNPECQMRDKQFPLDREQVK